MTNKSRLEFDRLFANQSAYVIAVDGFTVGRIVFRFGMAATVYVQLWGSDMVKGRAGGGGYDKQTMAIEFACEKLRKLSPDDFNNDAALGNSLKFISAIKNAPDGTEWRHRLEKAGFTIHIAI